MITIKNDQEYNFYLDLFVNKNLEVIKKLIESEIDLETQDVNGDTVLLKAVYYKMFPAVKMLLDAGANPNFKNKIGESILMLAVAIGNIPIIKELLYKVVNIDERNNLGDTAFIKASGMGSTEVVKLFLRSGVDVEIKTMYLEYTAYSIALKKGYLEIVKEIEIYSKNSIKYILENNHQAKDASVGIQHIEQHDIVKYSQEFAFIDIILKTFEFLGFECYSVQGHFNNIRSCLSAQTDEFVDDLSAICGANVFYHIEF